jgi:ankyrin repeat domain-containing protein 50
MFQFVLFARRSLTVAELRHTHSIQDNHDIKFTLSDEDFQRRIPVQPAISSPSHAIEGHRRIDSMEQRIIHCGGNFLEIKQNHGTVVS